ncbi:hypothetical protein GOBAR_AA23697 [Gossypium barbadense]|uniref:Uncharacterized protein n=1 Tax=Gossypium barbadense TaxID=3634 RepID=A0A2P5X0Z2_GOSBA|nr:hypothetical protein GOBAR_AA23697 [Gossypium barbadense]
MNYVGPFFNVSRSSFNIYSPSGYDWEAFKNELTNSGSFYLPPQTSQFANECAEEVNVVGTFDDGALEIFQEGVTATATVVMLLKGNYYEPSS